MRAMARFVYSMQTVLNVKKKTEDQVKMEFAQAQMKLNAEVDKLNELRGRKVSYIQYGVELRQTRLDVQEIADTNYAVAQMDVLIKNQERVVQFYRMEFEKVRARLRIAVQERKMQERLREKAFEEFLEEEKKAEFKEMDQRTSFTYGQRINEQE
ncbi:MAG: flagellar export protein FliJ [Butyrivibrio sp.]|nr:flagellar export protein FliJ [Butyrivibrio sp.]